MYLIGKQLSKLFSNHSTQKGLPKSYSKSKHPLSRSLEENDQQETGEEMKQKLAQVRSYLAEDSAQITQKILREVIQNGSSEQQPEAKQLYEITKKINHFKQNRFSKNLMPYLL